MAYELGNLELGTRMVRKVSLGFRLNWVLSSTLPFISTATLGKLAN